jgi:hypothetical protein
LFSIKHLLLIIISFGACVTIYLWAIQSGLQVAANQMLLGINMNKLIRFGIRNFWACLSGNILDVPLSLSAPRTALLIDNSVAGGTASGWHWGSVEEARPFGKHSDTERPCHCNPFGRSTCTTDPGFMAMEEGKLALNSQGRVQSKT